MTISEKMLRRVVDFAPFICLIGAWFGDKYPKYEWPILGAMAVFVLGLAIVVINRDFKLRKEQTDEDHLP